MLVVALNSVKLEENQIYENSGVQIQEIQKSRGKLIFYEIFSIVNFPLG